MEFLLETLKTQRNDKILSHLSLSRSGGGDLEDPPFKRISYIIETSIVKPYIYIYIHRISTYYYEIHYEGVATRSLFSVKAKNVDVSGSTIIASRRFSLSFLPAR